jgi:hypothetical protein
MTRSLALAALVMLAACAAPPRKPAAPGPAPVPPVPEAVRAPAQPAEVKDPNFILVVSETVPNPDNDGISFTKVFVDGQEVGRTAVGRKSEERTLKLRLPAGNQPVHFEQWILPGVGEWTRVDDALQPRERFVRIEDGSIARLELRFTDGEATNTLSLSREAAGH